MQGSCVPANGRRFTPACAGKSEHGHDDEPDDQEESPPRARGRASSSSSSASLTGITPACAGKRVARAAVRRRHRNHPRVRGEEHFARISMPCPCGITPACAGKRVMKMRPSRVWTYPLSANFSFFFGTSFECRAIPERGARRLFGCQASGLATCYASRIQEQTIGCFTGVHCLYPTSRSLRNGTEYNQAES